ncbi:MAG: VanZ family protein [Burkholderiales bacterium]|nr:VanZ family protein [Bacteroidia bacterium]
MNNNLGLNQKHSTFSIIKAYRFAFIWALFILVVCGINGASFPKIKFDFTFGADKLAHLILFGVQTWLILIAFLTLNKKPYIKYAFFAAVISSLFGVLIEILQATVFLNRSFDYADMLANASGAFLCLPLRVLLTKKV